MKKILLDENSCIGCGACVSIDSAHFDFNDDGLSSVINNENLDSEELKTAIESCPTGAISLSKCNNENCHCENCDCEDCKCDDCDNDNCNCENCNCK